ncbi:MAG: histidine kinase [Sphingomicrobium sp.]
MDAMTSTAGRVGAAAPLGASARAGRLFADWRMATRSILGFWLVYSLTVVARALLGGDAGTVLQNRAVTIVGGVLLTFGIYASINLLARVGSTRRRALIAFCATIIAACAQAGLMIGSDRWMHEPQDEFRFQAREGFVVIQKGLQIRIERHAAEPLTLTLPKVGELGRHDIVRVAADAMVVWLFFFAAWSAFYLAAQAQAEAAHGRQRIAEAETAARAAQVRALRYQVNPHFLFNTLNSLSALVLANRPAEAESMILKLAAFFRSSLTLDPTADVSLADEIALQQHYLDIEMVRFPKRLRVEVDIAPGLDRALLPALLLQPIVENAIKYGVSATREKVVLTIAARPADDGRLTVSVTNRAEGKARSAASVPPERGTGVGLANVCARLNARFGDAATCTFGPLDEGGYVVTMTFPFEPSPVRADD